MNQPQGGFTPEEIGRRDAARQLRADKIARRREIKRHHDDEPAWGFKVKSRKPRSNRDDRGDQ